MAKHTSGPWTVVTGGPDQLTIAHRPGDGLGSHIARLDARWLCDEHGGTIEANARLIAAAPDLLESLARVEARLTAAARAFYGTGKRSALVN